MKEIIQYAISLFYLALYYNTKFILINRKYNFLFCIFHYYRRSAMIYYDNTRNHRLIIITINGKLNGVFF